MLNPGRKRNQMRQTESISERKHSKESFEGMHKVRYKSMLSVSDTQEMFRSMAKIELIFGSKVYRQTP